MTPRQSNAIIRVAASADALAIKECVAAAYRHYIARMGKAPGPMLDDYAEVIARHAVFVAADNTDVIGVLVLIETEGGMLLDNIAVHPEHQGEGIGRQLMELAEDETRQHGYSRLTLYTHECMSENIAMYKRAGYLETERKTERGYQRVYMEKSINEK